MATKILSEAIVYDVDGRDAFELIYHDYEGEVSDACSVWVDECDKEQLEDYCELVEIGIHNARFRKEREEEERIARECAKYASKMVRVRERKKLRLARNSHWVDKINLAFK
jgi:hypothetical protein